MSDPFETVMVPLAVLRDETAKVFTNHGLVLRLFSVAPGPGVDGPHEVQMVASLAEEAPPATDPDFERVVAEARDAEVRQRADAARDELKKRLNDPGGIL
jgi:hypothetical protein